MIVVNFIGAPGAGKSTLAADVFAELKWLNINSELVTEYAKEMVWEENYKILGNQLFLLSQQQNRIERLKGKVDVVVTDSPIFHSLLYNDCIYPSFVNLVKEIHDSYDNLNFLVKRTKKYHKVGRMQTENESDLLYDKLIEILKSYPIPLIKIDGSKDSIPFIIEKIKERI
jgi:deoxyadenosine/deoxycytidine kinase